MRETPNVREQVSAEISEGNPRRRQNEHDAQEQQIHQVNHYEGKERAVIGKVRLFFRDHPAGKSEVKGPGRADQAVEKPAVRLHIVKQAESPVRANDDDAVERKKIGGERDPEIVPVRHDMTSLAANVELADAPTHEQHPKGMGQFVPEYINE